MDVLYVKDEHGNWVPVPAIGPESLIPAPPSEDGTYMLTVTVSGGTAVFAWARTT